MIKHIRFEQWLPDVDPEHYREVWVRHHAPILATRTKALRYTGTFFVWDEEGRPPLFGHAVSLWYSDIDHWNRAYGGPRPAPRPDDPYAKLLDRGHHLLIVGTEHALRDGPDAPSTSTWYLRSLGGAISGRLPREWGDDHVSTPEPLRFVTTVANEPDRAGTCRAVTEVSWATRAEREEGDRALALRPSFEGATRLVVGDRITVIAGALG